jgi:cytochrome b561
LNASYHPVAKILHWLTALLVLGLLAVGLWMVGLPFGMPKLLAFAWHKWIGLCVLVLAVLRLAWRRHSPPPALPASVTRWERRLAPLGHWALLLLILVQPLEGWLMSSAGGVQLFWFGYLRLPDLVPRDQDLFKVLRAAHHYLAFLLIGVIALHVAAVLRHDVLRRDGIFRRMWFQAGRGPT